MTEGSETHERYSKRVGLSWLSKHPCVPTSVSAKRILETSPILLSHPLRLIPESRPLVRQCRTTVNTPLAELVEAADVVAASFAQNRIHTLR